MKQSQKNVSKQYSKGIRAVAYQFLIFLILVCQGVCFSQNRLVIDGRVLDDQTLETLSGATVLAEKTPYGVLTNQYGYFSLEIRDISVDSLAIEVSYLGYETIRYWISDFKDQTVTFRIKPQSAILEEVILQANETEGLLNTTVGSINIRPSLVANLPVLLGEKDVFKTIHLLSGIHSNNEGNIGFNVRGGSFDQNLIQLDEATLFNPYHLIGLFSTINSDAVKELTLYKGGIPPRYGGRGSSIVDIQMKEGNKQEPELYGGIGLISSRIAYEAPIKKNQSSFIISARRSYADLIARALGGLEDDDDLYFYDVNAKMNFTLNEKNTLYISSYFGRDILINGEDLGNNWGNTTGTIRWNHLFNNKLFSNTTLNYSHYSFGFRVADDWEYDTSIEDISLKTDFSYYLIQSQIDFGLGIKYFTFSPGKTVFSSPIEEDIVRDSSFAFDFYGYASWSQNFSSSVKGQLGARISSFSQLGETTVSTMNQDTKKAVLKRFESGEVVQSYLNLEPRITLDVSFSKNSNLRFSYDRMVQYIHSLAGLSEYTPTISWLPSGLHLEPLKVDLLAIEFQTENPSKSPFKLTTGSYYKTLDQVTDLLDPTEILQRQNIELDVLSGKGRSYGFELSIEKLRDALTGWISYTFSVTENKIEGINDFRWYPANNDVRHNLSVLMSLKLHENWTFSLVNVLNTGKPYTFLIDQVNSQNQTYYTERNSYRLSNYHRIDLNLNFSRNPRSSWSFSVFNLLGRENPYFLFFNEGFEGVLTPEEAGLFPILLPSISWDFKWL